MEGDTVSVVVPTYYRNDRLRESLESVADHAEAHAQIADHDCNRDAH